MAATFEPGHGVRVSFADNEDFAARTTEGATLSDKMTDPGDFIGVECEKLGVNVHSLHTVSSSPVCLTHMAVSELDKFRQNTNATWRDALIWMQNLLGKEAVPIDEKKLRDSWLSIRNKRNKAVRNQDEKAITCLKETKYVVIKPRNVTCRKEDTGIKERELARFDRMVSAEKERNKELEKQLHDAYKENSKVKSVLQDYEQMEKEIKLEETKLAKRKTNMDELESHYKPHNVDRREKRKQMRIEELEKQIEERDEKISSLEKRLEKQASCEIQGTITNERINHRHFHNNSQKNAQKLKI
ncbi:golgin subfamily A member 6-like protein 25 [Ptychodera flava]|uniref:golgin subfamily A member 6-like protein 25 n=1 Tax=Ptychodera flava TaxID=63121 RepID=UPI003969C20A